MRIESGNLAIYRDGGGNKSQDLDFLTVLHLLIYAHTPRETDLDCTTAERGLIGLMLEPESDTFKADAMWITI